MSLVALALLLSLLLPQTPAKSPAAAPPTPPAQPATGPGGRDYSHQRYRMSEHGSGADAYFLFEPDSPRPASAPVIIFLHGWGATEPEGYIAWIEHIVRNGRTVVFPIYQGSTLEPPAEFTPHALTAVKAALARLTTEPGRVRPAPNQFALVGHSMGGLIAANLAARARAESLPAPKALMVIQPGRTWGPPVAQAPLDDLSRIPASTLLLSIVSDRDRVVRDTDGKRVFRESTSVPLANKDFITFQSDERGKPPLIADHRIPCAVPVFGADDLNPCPVNALDFFGTWKLLDALLDAAFTGRNRDAALGNTPRQRFMGRWSDGTPVKPLLVTKNP